MTAAALVGLANACTEDASCWRPVRVSADWPFVSSEIALAWAVLVVACLIEVVRRLARD
jgi:hypothetical protein